MPGLVDAGAEAENTCWCWQTHTGYRECASTGMMHGTCWAWLTQAGSVLCGTGLTVTHLN